VTEDDPAQTMIDWINKVPSADLATELMAAFGPDGTQSGDRRFGLPDFSRWLFRGRPHPRWHGDEHLGRSMMQALQLLEHSEMVMVYSRPDNRTSLGPSIDWVCTDLGIAILARGRDAVRQRIRDRTGL
jgi:hypothetical protein